MSASTLSSVARIRPVADTPVISGKLVTWAIFVAPLVVMAVWALAVSAPPEIESAAIMGLIGP